MLVYYGLYVVLYLDNLSCPALSQQLIFTDRTKTGVRENISKETFHNIMSTLDMDHIKEKFFITWINIHFSS